MRGVSAISVMGMKLCYSTLSSPNWNLQQSIDGAVQAGIGGIDFRGLQDEIDVTRLAEFNTEIDATLDRLREAGIEMPCLNTSVKLVTPSTDQWRTMLEEWNRHSRLAEKTHTPYLRIFGGAVPAEWTREEARVLSQRHLRQLIKLAKPFGCIPLLETHDHWATSDEVLELLHEFDPADVGVIWDVEHPCRKGESPHATADRLKRYIRHTHFKDSLEVDGERKPRLLGEGELPLKECLAALKHIGYAGWYCLETEKRWNPKEAPEPEISLPQFSRYMRQTG